MENIKSIQEINKIQQEIQLIIEKLTQLSEELTFYKQNFKIENYIENKNETIKESKIQIENILDRTLQLKQRNSICMNQIEEIENKIEKLKEIKQIMKEDQKQYNLFNKNLLEIIKEKENKMIEEEIQEIKNENKDELNEYEKEMQKLKEKIDKIKTVEDNKIKKK